MASETDIKARSKRHAYMTVAAACIEQVAVSGFMFNTFGLFADPICTDWGIMRSQFSVFLTLATIVNALIAMSVYGTIVKKFGLKKVFIFGCICCLLGMVSLYFATGLALLYTGGVLFALGACFLGNNTFNTMIMRRFSKKQGTMISWVGMLATVSGVIGSALVGQWIYDANIGYHGAFLIIFFIAAVCFACAIFLYKGDPEEMGETPLYADELETEGEGEEAYVYGMSAGETRKNAKYYVLAVAYFLLGFACMATMANVSLFCVDLGYAESAGFVMSVLWAASAIVSIPAGMVTDRLGSKTMVALCSACLAVGSVVFIFDAVPLPIVFVAAALFGIGYIECMIGAGMSVREAFGNKEFEKKVGFIVGSQILGAAAAPLILNLFFDFGGQTYDVALVVVIISCVITAVLNALVTRKPAYSA